MTEQEIRQQILQRFYSRLAADPAARAALRRIDKGKATLADTAVLSDRAADLLGEVFGAAVLDIPEDVREAVCEGLLRERHDYTMNTCDEVLEALDSAQGLHLTPQHPGFPIERVQQLASSLTDPAVKPETIQRRASKPVGTVAKSFHDSYIRINAQTRHNLGIKCYLDRVAAPGCCAWCTGIAGRYVYGDHPADIFRRHDNCSCTVTFENGRERQDVWSKRSWDAKDPKEIERVASRPAKLTQQQAEQLQENAVSRLTLAGERDIITGRGSGTGSASDTVHYFERIGKLNPDDKKAVAASLAEFERKYKDSSIEHCRVITKNGEVYEVHGDRYTVDTTLLGNLMNGSTNEHNHVTGESQYSFSWEDLIGSVNDGSTNALAFDEKFRYTMIFPKSSLSEDQVYDAYHRANDSVGNDMIFYPERIPEGDEQHERIRRACELLGIQYRRAPITR